MAKRIVLMLLNLSLIWGCSSGPINHVKIVNQTRLGVESGSLTIGRQVFEIQPLPPGAAQAFAFSSRKGATYKLSLTFVGGFRQTLQIGNLQTGIAYQDTLNLLKDRVELKSIQQGVSDQGSSGTSEYFVRWLLPSHQSPSDSWYLNFAPIRLAEA